MARVLEKSFQQVLALAAVMKEGLTEEEMWQILNGGDSAITREDIVHLIDRINAGFQGELNLQIDTGRLHVSFQDDTFRNWLLQGGTRGRPYAYFVDGHELIGKWATSEIGKLHSVHDQYSKAVESELPYWIKYGAIHLLDEFQERYRPYDIAENRGGMLSVSKPLLSAIEVLATLQQYAATHNSNAIEAVVRESLPYLADRLASCEPPFSDDLTTAIRTPLLQEQSERIGRKKILTLFCASYATEHLALVMRWIVRTGFIPWSEVVDEMLALNDYVVRYAVAEGQAEHFIQALPRADCNAGLSNSELKGIQHNLKSAAFLELKQLLTSTDINRQEMGCYAIASIAETFLVPGESQDQLGADGVVEIYELIKCVASMKYYFARSALGDMLIRLWSCGDSGTKVVEELSRNGIIDPVWYCHWEHTRLDTEFLDAAGINSRRTAACDENSKTDVTWYQSQVAFARKIMADLKHDNEGLHHSLQRSFRVIMCTPAVNKDFAGELSQNEDQELRQWINACYALGQSERVVDLFKVLFLQPLWSVGERVASMLTGFATSSEIWHYRICDLMLRMLVRRERHNWRIDYGVAETMFLLRPIEELGTSSKHGKPAKGGPRLFDLAVLKYFDHDVSRVRGNCVENFVADLKIVWDLGKKDQNGDDLGQNWLSRLNSKEWTKVIDHWLRDSDAWVLEHIYRLFRILHNIKTKSAMDDESVLGKWLCDRLTKLMESGNENCLLSIVQARAAAAGKTWADLERSEFLDCLEDAKAAMS